MAGLLAWHGAVSSSVCGRWDGLAVRLHPCAAPSADDVQVSLGGKAPLSPWPSAICFQK